MTLRAMIEPDHPHMSIVRQCELLGLPRSTFYYQPSGESEENLALKLYTRYPFLALEHDTHVNRKRVQRLMRKMGLKSVLPQPGTSAPHPEHKVYPYLLRGVKVSEPDHVWSTDITFILVLGGWAYLVAVMDWATRYVFSWEVSNTMEVSFCLEALKRALRGRKPRIFNSDQGAQFTSPRFVSVLEEAGIQVSMDGKGRCLDNVWVERLWRSVKYEEVYLNEYEDVLSAWRGLARYFDYYNFRRPHQSLNYQTPAEAYLGPDWQLHLSHKISRFPV